MMNEKVALITGAARGIGRAIAVALAKEKWRVVINYRQNADAAKEALKLVESAGGRGIVVQADIADAADRARLVAQTLEAFARIDLLVNNAAMGPRRRVDLLEMTETSYDEVMATNLKGPFFLTQLVARRMIETENRKGPNHQYRLDQRLHEQHEPRRVLPLQGRHGDDDRAFRPPPGGVRDQRLRGASRLHPHRSDQPRMGEIRPDDRRRD